MGKNKILTLTVILLLFLFGILYNFINLKGDNYPLTEGLQYNLINLDSYYPHGKTLDFPLDIKKLEKNNINKDIFINGGFMLNKNDKLYPFSLAGSSYIFSPILKIINIKNYSFIISIFGIISLIYFFLSSKILIKSNSLALLGTILFAFFYGIFQYFSIIGDSAVALSIFIVSYFYFLKYYQNSKSIDLFIASILFTTVIVIRIDYALMVPIILILIFTKVIRNINIKLLGIIALILLIFSTFFISNLYRHGNPISLGYEKEKANIEYVQNIGEKNQIKILIKRFFSNFDDINAAQKRFIANQKFLGYIMNISFIFIFFFLIKKKKNLSISRKQLYFQFIYIVFIYVYISSMYFTDVGTSWIMSVHTRYLLPFYFVILLYSFSFGLNYFYKKVRYFQIIFVILLLLSVTTFLKGFNQPLGMHDLINRKEKTQNFYKKLSVLSKNDFVFSFFDRSGSINLNKNGPYIIHLPYIKGQNITNKELLNSINYLLKNNKNVYIYNISINNTKLRKLYNNILEKYRIIHFNNNIYKLKFK